MKNKEYIRWLKQLDEGLTFDGLVNGKEKVDLHEMIFELCEKLDQEPCEDSISRQAVDDAIYDYSRACDVDYAQIMEYIDKLPSVTPQPKTGHWNITELFQGGIKETWYECSECEWSNALVIPRNYCPNCGAKMESEE